MTTPIPRIDSFTEFIDENLAPFQLAKVRSHSPTSSPRSSIISPERSRWNRSSHASDSDDDECAGGICRNPLSSDLKPVKAPKTILHYLKKIEQLFPVTNESLAFYPIAPANEPDFQAYKAHENMEWKPDELSYIDDVPDYENATVQERHIIDTILAFFVPADGSVVRNIIFRFLLESTSLQKSAYLISQIHRELIHSEVYGLACLTFVKEPLRVKELIAIGEATPCSQKKIDFMNQWTFSEQPLYHRLVAFACAEGIFFCTLFAAVFWFRSKGKFSNFVVANEMIAKDESQHRDRMCQLAVQEYDHNPQNNLHADAIAIVQQAIEIEDAFVAFMLKDGDVDDLSVSGMQAYARVVADSLLHQLGIGPIFRVTNPFTWIDTIGIQIKTDFFTGQVGAYSRHSLPEILNWKRRAGLTVDPTKVDPFTNPGKKSF